MSRMKNEASKPGPLAARAKIWLEADGTYIFGLGISNILKAVDQEGSIKAAAVVVGKSYRHIWARIKEVEQALGVSMVNTTIGGNEPRRSELTSEAKLLVKQFDRLRQRVFQLLEKESAAILDAIQDPEDAS